MAQAAQRGTAAENSLLLSFRVGKDRYAIAVSWIREVLVPGLRIAVPRAPSAVWGVDTHHGRAYAVIDLRTFFNVPGQVAPAVAADQRIIALESQDRDLALLVDAVDSVGPREDARADAKAKPWIDGKNVVKVIFVKKTNLLNFVVKD